MPDPGQLHQAPANLESIETTETTDSIEPPKPAAPVPPSHPTRIEDADVWQRCASGPFNACEQDSQFCCSSCGHRCSAKPGVTSKVPPIDSMPHRPLRKLKTMVNKWWKKVRKTTATTSPASLGSKPACPLQDSIFRVVAPVAMYHALGIDHASMEHAQILYDPGCEFDAISTDYLRTRREPEYAKSRQILAASIVGTPIHTEGREVRIRWHDPNYSSTRLMDTTCQVVQSTLFDIIIGRATIERLELFTRNPVVIAPVLAPLPTVAVETPAAKARREALLAQERREQEQREREKSA